VQAIARTPEHPAPDGEDNSKAKEKNEKGRTTVPFFCNRAGFDGRGSTGIDNPGNGAIMAAMNIATGNPGATTAVRP